jgi:hypothetical protein
MDIGYDSYDTHAATAINYIILNGAANEKGDRESPYRSFPKIMRSTMPYMPPIVKTQKLNFYGCKIMQKPASALHPVAHASRLRAALEASVDAPVP